MHMSRGFLSGWLSVELAKPLRSSALRLSASLFRFVVLGCAIYSGFVVGSVVADAQSRFDSVDGYALNLLDESLSRWVVTGAPARCDGSELALSEGTGFVRTAHDYGDFVLELEYKPEKTSGYDCRLFFRCQPPGPGEPWPDRYQIRLKDGEEGSLVGAAEARTLDSVRRGQWNRLKLTVVGHTARLDINDQLAWKVDTIEPLHGYIGLAVGGASECGFRLRNVRIREVGFQSLFNGRDLDGWQPASGTNDGTWTVEDGVLLCTGKPGTWLRSATEYADFNLRLEYLLREGGNSGVYIRVSADGNHHGANSGIEVQILDDASERYRNLKPYQYSASLYAIVPATPRVSRAAGQWNVLEIDCRGQSYVVRHNGQVVVQSEGTLVAELKQRRTSGYLGLQNHSEPVQFRHIRIGPSLQPEDASRPISDVLSRRIVDADQPLREVQEFCRARVARMPALESREQWMAYAESLRRTVLERVVFRGEASKWRDAPCHVEWLDTLEVAPEYRIRKLRYEALPGLWIPALLYEPKALPERAPVFLNVNGHDAQGKAAPYKQIRCINMAKRGILALNVEWFGMGQLRSEGFVHYRMNQLDLCGTSGLAPFVLAMQRGLDILLSHPHADPARVGVAGLSGGGWQTITIAALDLRVTLANPVAGYSSFLTRVDHFSDLGDSEQTPTDLAAYADYTHYTAMLAPRHALLTFNSKDDCCFASGHALPPLSDAARPVYRLLEVEDRLLQHVNHDPGTHNFERDNREALYRAIQAAFYPGNADFSTTEIPCDREVQSAEKLDVPLPESNLDFHQLARQLADKLPRSPQRPANESDSTWFADRRAQLSRIVRYHGEYAVEGSKEAEENWRNCRVTYWKLRVLPDWTIPAVEIVPDNPRTTTLVIGHSDRAALDKTVQLLVNDGHRVLICDLFYWGESKISQRDFLFALLVNSVGERPLGIQASQLSAIARWLSGHRQLGQIGLRAEGPRASLAALVSAALQPETYRLVELHQSLPSLKSVIESNMAVNQSPEYFCFGLLEHFEIDGLICLAGANRIVRTPNEEQK